MNRLGYQKLSTANTPVVTRRKDILISILAEGHAVGVNWSLLVWRLGRHACGLPGAGGAREGVLQSRILCVACLPRL